ncbi:MAG: heparinase II/III family protein [Armatimonadetes bacterium]|nr:heparinase II/III family protein [Armatimonadota bacterium]
MQASHNILIGGKHLRLGVLLSIMLGCSVVWASDLPTFFDRLALTRPGLAQVRAAVEAGDYPRAAAELKAYYQARREPHFIEDRSARPAADPARKWPAADNVLAREYAFVGKHAALAHDLDWNADPLKDPEWPIELNRHYTWVQLSRAYWYSHDEKYAADLCYQIADWLADNPRPATPWTARFTWRTLECGIRLSGSWPEVFFRVIDSPSFTPELLCGMLDAVWQQADYLRQFHGGGNWLVCEKSGQLAAGILFPEFRDAEHWTSGAWEVLSRELRDQVLPDGAQIELTPHYHGATLSSFRAACDVAVKNGVPLPPGYSDDMRRMYEYLMYVVKPNGNIPMFNDSDRGNERGWMADGARRFGAQDMLFVASGGKDGTAPAGTSHAFPWAGQYVMRSGWSQDDLYLALDAGPYGYGHQHEDKLTIDLWAFGQDLIVDPGRYTYAGGKWRTYFVSTASHPTALVDGQGQRRRRTPSGTWVNREPQDNRWFTSDDVDFVTGSYDDGYAGAEEAVHVRKVLFVRARSGAPRYFLVSDLLLPSAGETKPHELTVQYQLARPGATLDPATLAVNSTGKGVGLLVRPVGRADLKAALHEGEEDPPAGWVAWSLHQALKEPATLVRYSQQGPLPLTMVTLLLPYKGDIAPPLTVKQLEVCDAGGPVPPERGTALEIAGDGWRDVCYFSHDCVRRRVRFAGLETDAEIAIVRAREDGKPQVLCLYGGTTLASAGAEPLEAGTAPLPPAVDLTEHRVEVTVAQPTSLALRYGYAAGGGLLFETGRTEPVTTAIFRIHDPKLELPYCYEVVAYDAAGERILQRGQIILPEPRAFNFDDRSLAGWSASGAKVVAGYNGTRGALRVQGQATTDVCYVGAERTARLTVTTDLRVGLAFRSPMAGGGEYFYTKVTLRTEDGDDWSAYFSRAPVADWQELALTLKDFRGDTYQGANLGKPLAPGQRVAGIRVTLRKGKTEQPVAPCFEVDEITYSE